MMSSHFNRQAQVSDDEGSLAHGGDATDAPKA